MSNTYPEQEERWHSPVLDSSYMPATVEDRRPGNFYRVDNAFLDEWGPLVGATGVAVYNVLARFAHNDKRDCYPSYETIARRVNIHRTTAIRAIRQLADAGLIEIRKRKHDDSLNETNVFVLLPVKPPGDQNKG